MKFRFPLKDVTIELANRRKIVESPLLSNGFFTLNQNEFSMDVKGVAWFYISKGDYISIVPYPGADKNNIELYLNGSGYGAILHQRMILPLHGSSFLFNNKGVAICGESGVGKSSITTAFCLDGADFMTDDVTPIIFQAKTPYIWTFSDGIKLWTDSFDKLNIAKTGLCQVDPDMDKYYFPMSSTEKNLNILDIIFILGVHKKDEIKIIELEGIEKFFALRNEIYRYEYLEGMKDSERAYFGQLIFISKKVAVLRVLRPENIELTRMCIILTECINNMSLKKLLI